MSSKVTLDVKGLVLAPGELSRASGSLVTATNVNVEAPGVIRSRNGVARQTYGPGGPGWKLLTSKQLDTNLLYNYGSATVATSLKYGTGGVAWTALGGTVTNQPATRMQAAVSNRNHYLTSDEGVRRLENSFSTLWFAGMPKALAIDLTGTVAAPVTVLSGSPGTLLADTESVAYRQTWAKKDAEGIMMEGAPSSRTVVYNNTRTSGWVTGTTKNVTCRIMIPTEALTATTALTTAYFYRLYRSPVAATGVTASDEMNLVAQGYLTSANITAGYVEVTDATPEAFRALGDALYTNEVTGGDVGPPDPSGDPLTGIQLANDPPPRARDVALFADCMFYSDFIYPHVQEFTILSTVSGTGVTAGDTITINSVVFTAIAPGAPANNEFVVATVAAGSSASEAVERTAQNLVAAINRSTSTPGVWAYYVSDPEGLPGKVRIEQRTHSIGFAVTVSAHGTAYRPSLDLGVNSSIDSHTNGFVYSKPLLADAVPLVNFGTVGPNTGSILRMVVLRDALYLFTSAGLYRLTGRSAADFAAQEFDLTFRLLGREMVTVCDDAIYAWGIEGIAKITAAGVEYISNAIEPLVQKVVLDAGETWLATYAWATSYQSRHKVLFSVPTSGTNKNCATTYVYDTRMQAWTSWAWRRAGSVTPTGANPDGVGPEGHSCGVIRASDDLLCLGQWDIDGGDTTIFLERRAYAAADYKDDTFNTVDQAISKTVRWNAATSSPEKATHWDELHLLYDVSHTVTAWTTPSTLTATFTADFASAGSASTITPTAASRMSRCLVSQAQRRSARLSVTVVHSTASEYFGLEGMVLVHLPGEGTATVRT